MIDVALRFLRDDMNAAFRGAAAGSGDPDLVTFVAGDKIGDAVTFTLGHVCLLLVKLEEEHLLRNSDPFARVAANGTRERVQPEVRLNLYVLFVPHFADYMLSLRWLSQVVAHFQNRRVFTSAGSPTLDPGIEQLTVELVTQQFNEQNEVWGALRTSYRPSALYRVRMLTFADTAAEALPIVKEVRVELPA